MGLAISTIEDAIRAAVVAAVADATVPVIFAQQSAPRPVTVALAPWVALYLLGIESPEHDDAQPLATHTITAVNQGARQFTVAGDRRLFYPVASSVIVADSTNAANDGTYTVTAVAFAGGATTVTVAQAIPNATASGVLTGARQVHGHRVLPAQIDVYGANALQRAEQIRARLALESILATLATAGLAVYRHTPVRDLTGLLDTAREPRGNFEVRFAVESVEHEYVGTIERVTGTQTALDAEGATVRADDLDVDMLVEPYDPGP